MTKILLSCDEDTGSLSVTKTIFPDHKTLFHCDEDTVHLHYGVFFVELSQKNGRSSAHASMLAKSDVPRSPSWQNHSPPPHPSFCHQHVLRYTHSGQPSNKQLRTVYTVACPQEQQCTWYTVACPKQLPGTVYLVQSSLPSRAMI